MIRKLLTAAAFAMVLSPAALAQQTAAMGPKFSTEKSTIGQLLDNAEAKAAFAKVLPDIANNPDIEQGRDYTLKAVAEMGYVEADKLKVLDVELAKIK